MAQYLTIEHLKCYLNTLKVDTETMLPLEGSIFVSIIKWSN